MPRYVPPSLTPGAIDDSSNSPQVLHVMLELTHHVLGVTDAWLLERGEDCCEVVMQNPAGCDPVPLPGKMMTGQFHKDPYPHCILKDGSRDVCLDVLRASDKQDPFYLVAVKLAAQMDLGGAEERAAGRTVLRLYCRVHQSAAEECAGRHKPLGVLCRVPQASERPSSLDARGPLKRPPGTFDTCVSYGVCNLRHQRVWAGSGKKYQEPEVEWCMHYHDHENP